MESQKQACLLISTCSGLMRNQAVVPVSHAPNAKFPRLSLLVSRVLWGENILCVKKSRRRSFNVVVLGTGGDVWLSGREGPRPRMG